MNRFEIKKGMILRSFKNAEYQIEVVRKKDMRWQCRKLTTKTGVYNGTHSMSQITLWKNFEPV